MKDLWDAVETKILIKSFKQCGISNVLDSIEDDLSFEGLASDVEEFSSDSSGDEFLGFDNEDLSNEILK